MKTGLFVRGFTQYDNAPDQARRDVARKLADVASLIARAGRDPAEYAVEYADAVIDEILGQAPWASALPRRGDPPSTVTHARAADRARLLAIDLLALAHVPPPEPIPTVDEDEGDDTRRPAFFDVLKIHHLGGVDATARCVGGFSE